MFQFNSNKLIKLCRKLIGMIEDNQIAEELTDRISGIENKYCSKYELNNKWRLRVDDMISLFNSKCRPDEILTVVNNYQIGEERKIWQISNRYNSIRKDFIVHPQDSVFIASENFFEFAFEVITEHGIVSYFSNKSKILNKCHGEESFNVTYS